MAARYGEYLRRVVISDRGAGGVSLGLDSGIWMIEVEISSRDAVVSPDSDD